MANKPVVISGALCCALISLTAAGADKATPDGADSKLEASILIVDSQDAIATWVKDPKGGDVGRIRKATAGQKLFVPIIVTGLKTTELGQPGIAADMQFVSPSGKVIFNGRKCCGASRGDQRTPGLVVLNPVLDFTTEDGDAVGTYEVRATVTYGGRTATASEKFVLEPAANKPEATADSQPAVAAAPARPARAKNHADARNCLDATDNAAVMRCAEKYR